MTSLKTLAKTERGKEYYYTDTTRAILVPALLEIAHALSRRRKPSSCSLLPGKNIREWLREVYFEKQRGVYNGFGESCSHVEELEDVLVWDHKTPDTTAILRAIRLCRAHLRPVALPRDLRGDYDYQERNAVTNLKRKARWREQRNGSWYNSGFED